MEYNDQQLDKLLGTESISFAKYRTLSVDNGSDLAGTGATGVFVEKAFNDTTKTIEKKEFAKTFQGVILSTKAQLVDKGKKPTWRTEEFDIYDKDYQIAIYPLLDGKFVKDSSGEIKVSHATYQEIKRSRSVVQLNGTLQSTYNYMIVLYVGVGEEIIKLKFKGTARGNYFDYSKAVNKTRIKIYNLMTEFSTFLDKETAKYTIGFRIVKDENGIPVEVDYDSVRNLRIDVAKGLTQFSHKQLPDPSSDQDEPEVEYEPDYSNVVQDEIADVPVN